MEVNKNSFLKHKLTEYRLADKDTDVTLVCAEGTTFRAHKLILKGASPYFEKMFTGSFEEARTGVSRMDFDPKTMEAVLDFVYLENDATIHLDNLDQVEPLLRAAEMFHIPSLFRLCCTEAKELLTAKNVSRVCAWNKLYVNEHIQRLHDNYFGKFWRQILDSDLYWQSDVQHFTVLVDKWVKFNKEKYTNSGANAARSSVGYNQDYCKSTHRWTIAQHIAEGSPDGLEKMIAKTVKWVKVNEDDRNQYFATFISKLNIARLSSPFVRTLMKEPVVKNNCDVLMHLLDNVIDQ